MKYAKNMPITPAEAYLMGMFSTLNHLVDISCSISSTSGSSRVMATIRRKKLDWR